MIGLIFPVPVLAVVLWFVLGQDGLGEFPAGWTWQVPLALAVGAYSYCELAGFRAKPLGPGGDPAEVENQSWLQFNKAGFVRFVICESVFMVTIPIGFIVDSYWPILIGAVLALPLIAWECWPGVRNRRRYAAALESAGHPSYLLGRPQDLR
jgi:hypothetical protein